MDLLDAAYDLLRTANRPLTAKEMVDSILKMGCGRRMARHLTLRWVHEFTWT